MRRAVAATTMCGLCLAGCDALIGADFGARSVADGGETTGNETGGAGGTGGTGGSSTTTGGGGAGGEPTDCWGNASSWTTTMVDKTLLAGNGPADLTLSRDGKTLYYVADAGGDLRPHSATRASRDEPFSGGNLVAGWPSLAGDAAHLWVFGDEMMVRTDRDTGGLPDWQLSLSQLDGQWTVPQVISELSDDAKRESWPRAVADGTHLFFTRPDGPPVVVKENGAGSQDDTVLNAIHLNVATRPASSEPGTPFGNEHDVVIPGIVDTDFIACFVPSWDGLRLFLGTTKGITPSNETFDGAVRVWLTERSSLAEPWSAPVLVDELNARDEWTCPLGITEDGCEMTLSRSQGASPYTLSATRTPL